VSARQHIIKRLFDALLAAVGLAFLWPVILVCIGIARSDTGLSGLFIQDRVGQHGKLVRIRKIRTMRPIEGIETTVTAANDRRISDVGRKLRRLKLDELPQLWSVLVGDMSFVGPRPDVPGYADRLTGDDRNILQLKPGITGPATIKYRDEETMLSASSDAEKFNDEVVYPDKVKINLAYLNQWTLLGDIKYIFITLRVLPVPAHLVVSSNSL